tara:strand:+ start:83 stop:649 length:567 start_codon:yes stop_codon:yes gene_type:complete
MGTNFIIPQGYPLSGEVVEEIISAKEIRQRVREIAMEISLEYKEKNPIIVGVLNGAFIFMSDLVRELNIQFEVDFIKISSYNDEINSSGSIKLDKDFTLLLKNRDIIVIEDIVDTGLSLKYLADKIINLSPKSLKFVTLLYKSEIASKEVPVDWSAFNIEDKFVIGYGLDLRQNYRGLSSIYAVKKER